VPKAIVCDILKAGVATASRYEPGVNRTYQDLAAHYGTKYGFYVQRRSSAAMMRELLPTKVFVLVIQQFRS
jgi:hypothetical protein